MTEQTKAYFNTPVHERDPLVAQALDNERKRQQDQIELIASENIVSRAVLDALGHEMTNKTLEGYPGNRFHGGGQFVDPAGSGKIEVEKRFQIFLDCNTPDRQEDRTRQPEIELPRTKQVRVHAARPQHHARKTALAQFFRQCGRRRHHCLTCSMKPPQTSPYP